MIKGEMAGRGGCTDRKQSLFLSSYHDWVQPWGPDQRDAPCFHSSQRVLVLHRLFHRNCSHLLYPCYSFLPRWEFSLNLSKSCWWEFTGLFKICPVTQSGEWKTLQWANMFSRNEKAPENHPAVDKIFQHSSDGWCSFPTLICCALHLITGYSEIQAQTLKH